VLTPVSLHIIQLSEKSSKYHVQCQRIKNKIFMQERGYLIKIYWRNNLERNEVVGHVYVKKFTLQNNFYEL
jgi:hypothetical protein